MYQDKTLQCSGCGASFTHSAQDQEFFASKGFTNEPKRWPACRESQKTERGNTGFGNRNYSSQRPIYSATCADCGQAAQVPFEPRNGKPVYCSDCYRKVRS